MSVEEDTQQQIETEDEEDFKPPPPVSIDEIINFDKDDESLIRYKETLLGNATKEVVLVEPGNSSRVIVRNLAMIVDGRDDIDVNLSDPSNLTKTFAVKEGIQYRIRIDFHVQREIVTGLKYIQKIFRHGIQCEKITHMVGSYAPKTELQSYTTPLDEMPSGVMARGTYKVKSVFTDDDKNEYLRLEWSFELKKEWE